MFDLALDPAVVGRHALHTPHLADIDGRPILYFAASKADHPRETRRFEIWATDGARIEPVIVEGLSACGPWVVRTPEGWDMWVAVADPTDTRFRLRRYRSVDGWVWMDGSDALIGDEIWPHRTAPCLLPASSGWSLFHTASPAFVDHPLYTENNTIMLSPVASDGVVGPSEIIDLERDDDDAAHGFYKPNVFQYRPGRHVMIVSALSRCGIYSTRLYYASNLVDWARGVGFSDTVLGTEQTYKGHWFQSDGVGNLVFVVKYPDGSSRLSVAPFDPSAWDPEP